MEELDVSVSGKEKLVMRVSRMEKYNGYVSLDRYH